MCVISNQVCTFAVLKIIFFFCVCVCLGYIKSGYTVSKETSWLVYSKKVANVISITVRYTIECCLLVILLVDKWQTSKCFNSIPKAKNPHR